MLAARLANFERLGSLWGIRPCQADFGYTRVMLSISTRGCWPTNFGEMRRLWMALLGKLRVASGQLDGAPSHACGLGQIWAMSGDSGELCSNIWNSMLL